MSFSDVSPYTPISWPEYHEYHGVTSVYLGELAEVGWFDLSKPEWDFLKYSPEQHTILCNKITNRFWDREIGYIPPGLWKRKFLEKLNEIMPKYIRYYALLANNPNLFGGNSEYYKSRNIFSDFPQTQLGGNSDYASTGNDIEYEKIKQEDILSLQEALDAYKDIDEMILDELDCLFSGLISVSINAL